MPTITGWIFDGYPVRQGISVWIIDQDGRMHVALDRWQPRLFVGDSPRLSRFLARNRIPMTTGRTERRDFYTLASVPVVEIRVHNPLAYNRFVAQLEAIEGLTLYNCDLHLVQTWHYERDHFPLAKGTFVIEEKKGDDGVGLPRLLSWEITDSPWDIDYALPPLRYLRMGLEGRTTDPNHAGV